jgi:NAD(P)-dependent dehydrogenase (short-subunit alcohol dehydrogenase family)
MIVKDPEIQGGVERSEARAFRAACRMNMSRIFVTGSADGLGKMAAQLLIDQGHQVVLHARNKMRAQEALAAVPGAETVAVGDVATSHKLGTSRNRSISWAHSML